MRKGVGLISLAMYVVGLTILVGIITVFNLNVLDATNDYNEIAMLNEQYAKFNMYFINSIKKADYLTFDNNVITLYLYDSDSDGEDEELCTYTYRPSNADILYHSLDSEGKNINISVCKHINTNNIEIQVDSNDEISQGKYSKITIGGNPMFVSNDSSVGFTDVTYVVGRGY